MSTNWNPQSESVDPYGQSNTPGSQSQPSAAPYGQSSASNYAPQPSADPYAPQPSADPYAPQPSADPYAPQPSADPYGQPSADPYAQQPGPYAQQPDPYAQGYDVYGQPAAAPYPQQADPYAQQSYGYGYQPAPYAGYGAIAQVPGAPWGVDPKTGLPYSEKTKLAAGLLGIFLGGVGAGRFYTGHYGLAIAQLVVSVVTLGFGAIWGLIDGIMMLAGDSKDSNGYPLRP